LRKKEFEALTFFLAIKLLAPFSSSMPLLSLDEKAGKGDKAGEKF